MSELSSFLWFFERIVWLPRGKLCHFHPFSIFLDLTVYRAPLPFLAQFWMFPLTLVSLPIDICYQKGIHGMDLMDNYGRQSRANWPIVDGF
jgi:hypothetical protein